MDGERSSWTCCSRSGQSGEAGSGRHITPRHRRRTGENRRARPSPRSARPTLARSAPAVLPPHPCPSSPGGSPAPPRPAPPVSARSVPAALPAFAGCSPSRSPPGPSRQLASQWFNANGTGTLHWTGCRQLDGWQPRAGQGKEAPRARSAAAGGRDRAPPRPRPPPPAPGSALPHGPFRAELAPKAAPSRFQRLLPKSHLSPSNASSSPENRGDVGKASGNMPGRNRRASTVGLCSKKGSTVPQQSDQAVINQPALT